MSDHGSGPRASADPVMDISDFYAFPSPERARQPRPGDERLPVRHADRLFSRCDRLPLSAATCRDRFQWTSAKRSRLARPRASSASPSEMPRSGEADGQFVQDGDCTIATGETIAFRVGDEHGTEQNGLRVFAGCRLDSFFIDQSDGHVDVDRVASLVGPRGRSKTSSSYVLAQTFWSPRLAGRSSVWRRPARSRMVMCIVAVEDFRPRSMAI